MLDKNLLQQIKSSVAIGKEKEAIVLLTTYCSERKYQDLEQHLLVISGNLQELNRKEINYTIAAADAAIEKNKIRDQILTLTQEAERYADPIYRRNKELGKVKAQASKNGTYIAYGLGIVMLLVGLFFIGNYFYDKSSQKMDELNKKEDDLTLIDANIEDKTLTQAAPIEQEEEIELENIKEISNSQKPTEYEFPIIDFKFYNKGNAQAYINAFFIDVLEYELDETPLLSMDFDFSPETWNIHVINKGWGTAKKCNCKIESEALEHVFTKDQLQFEKDILPSNERNLRERISFSLRADIADFARIEEDSVYLDEGVHVNCTFLNKGEKESMEYTLHQHVLLRASGFYLLDNVIRPNFVVTQRSANYLTYINSEEKTYEYRDLYHIITPEGAERFQITIGSNQSCRAKIQFRFLTNDEREIKSKPFVVDIWRPKTVDTPLSEGDVLKILEE